MVLVARRSEPGRGWVEAADWPRVLVLGLVGGTLYQILFMYGVARTSVANTGLIFGASPVLISLLSAAVGHERVPWVRWAGGALSLAGLYLVVGAGASVSRESLLGDAVVTISMLCWSIYSVASRPLLGRYSPLVLTAWVTTVGTVPYTVVAVPTLLSTAWAQVSVGSWTLMAGSSLICLVLSYAAWYTGVQRLGATRTSAYSNLTPIAAMVTGWLWIGEAVTGAQAAGAAAILLGVFLTRLSPVVLAPIPPD
jgi:drug/metabolite transporter (DMT)-like permease